MKQLIEETLKEIDNMCLLFILDEWQEANLALTGVLTKIQNTIVSISGNAVGQEYAQKLLSIMEVVSQAMLNEDAIQIADLMGYDIKMLLQEYYMIIRQEEAIHE